MNMLFDIFVGVVLVCGIVMVAAGAAAAVKLAVDVIRGRY